MSTETEHPLNHLTPERIDALADEFDALHDQVKSELGERDAAYIRGIIDLHRRLALLGRVLLVGSKYRPMWLAGTATLSVAKILENMEIGHNVMHGQWDWMNDPVINSSAWDWDSASTAEAWKHSHNYVHHTYTNILGKDRDLGYAIMRIDPQQRWYPIYLAQPFYNLILMALFEWGVAAHDLDLDAIRAGEKPKEKVFREMKGMVGKAKDQVVKDYVAFPLLSAVLMTAIERGVLVLGGDKVQQGKRAKARRGARRAWAKASRRGEKDEAALSFLTTGLETYRQTLLADATANVIRNVWAHAIIFCGHFPDQVYTFSKEETENETRGARYVRQLIGAANIEGGPMFHVMSGNLGYQVEHHLYPDMPSTRYAEIAPKVRDICERYELPYNTGPFLKQWGMVQRTILRLALPGGKARPKPGPYKGEPVPDEGVRPPVAA